RQKRALYWGPSFYNGKFYARFWDKSGNKSTWSASGNFSVSLAYACDLGAQNANNVSTTGIRTGGGGATKVRSRLVKYHTEPLAGGSAATSFNLNIASQGFSAKPDAGQIEFHALRVIA